MNTTTRQKGELTITVLTPDEDKLIINQEYVTYKQDGGDMPQLLLAKEVCLAVTDHADRYTEIDQATAEAWQKEYDEAMQQQMEMPMEEGEN